MTGGADVAPVFLQYGALGAVAMLAIYAVAKLFTRSAAQADTAIAAERARADRLEKQLADNNATMIEKILPIVLASTQAMTEFLAEIRKDNGRGR